MDCDHCRLGHTPSRLAVWGYVVLPTVIMIGALIWIR